MSLYDRHVCTLDRPPTGVLRDVISSTYVDLLLLNNTCSAVAAQQNNNTPFSDYMRPDFLVFRVLFFVLTFLEAGEVEPLFSETPHQQTPRFFQGIGGRIPPCLCHLLRRWRFRDVAGRWNWSVPCWHPPSPARSSGRWSPTFSSSDIRILGPQAGLPPTLTSRLPPPSSVVSVKDLHLCFKRKRAGGCREVKWGGDFFCFSGSQILHRREFG